MNTIHRLNGKNDEQNYVNVLQTFRFRCRARNRIHTTTEEVETERKKIKCRDGINSITSLNKYQTCELCTIADGTQ